MKPLQLLRWEYRWRPHLLQLPPLLSIGLYSSLRPLLWKLLSRSDPGATTWTPPEHFHRRCWGIRFRFPLFNAAGMFKYGEGYEYAYAQGAGAYVVGTTTGLPRRGRRYGVMRQPFLPLPRSGAALNALGLPNDGHLATARRIARLPRYPDFPIIASLALDGELHQSEALRLLLQGLHAYCDAGADLLELNESCPNIPHDPRWEALLYRLHWIAEHFLARRPRAIPVVVKLGLDLPVERLLQLLELLPGLGYDGIVLGNTSTAYEALLPQIDPSERRAYNAFWQHIGGGVSGRPLRPLRQELLRQARTWLQLHPPQREFHLIAVGGIATPEELAAVLSSGALLAQWMTGYFEVLARDPLSPYAYMSTALVQDP